MIDCFRFYCNKVLPLVYDNSLSYYEVLCKVRDRLNELITEVNKHSDAITVNQKAIAAINQKIEEINQEITHIKDGDYIENYIEALKEWIDNNLRCWVTRLVKYVFFGLTDDGHFAAYVPDCWRFLNFSTPLDVKSKCYGHLILKW